MLLFGPNQKTNLIVIRELWIIYNTLIQLPTMHFWSLFIFVSLLAGTISLQAEAESINKLELSQLEQRLKVINTEISQLAHTSLRAGDGAIGYRSGRHDTDENTE